MKKFLLVFLTTLLILSLPVSASELDDFYAWYLNDNSEELDMMHDLLAEHELEWGSCIDGEAENIDKSRFFRRYRFNCLNFVKGYEESKSVFALIEDKYDIAYFGQGFGCITIFMKTDNEWEEALQIGNNKDPGEERSFYIKDMLEGILNQHPDLDYDSVKYIEHDDSSSAYIYFTEEGEEYLATFPYWENEDDENYPGYGDIYKAQDLMELLAPRFQSFENRKEGYIYGSVEQSKEDSSLPVYVYIIPAAIVVAAASAAVVIIIRKRRKAD